MPTAPGALSGEELTPEEKIIRARATKLEAEKAEKEALAEMAKRDSPAMAKARKELEKETDKQKKIEKQNAGAISNAAVAGCDPRGMVIQPRATGSYSYQSHVKIRVINLHSRPVSIEDESGVIVENLCPGGSITLFRARHMWTDGNYYTFHYIARGQFPDGSLGMQQSQSFYLSAYDVSSGRSQQFASWNVQLQKFLPPR